jgi:hypothetical protein
MSEVDEDWRSVELTLVLRLREGEELLDGRAEGEVM